MNLKNLLLLGVIFIALACLSNTLINNLLTNPKGKTIAQRFYAPKNYIRVAASDSSFASFLRALTLKPDQSAVLLYDGSVKGMAVHEAVLTIDVGKQDLQQCADAVMRLRAEYLYKKRKYDAIHFNFTSGFNAQYLKWAHGYRIKVSGNNCVWKKTTDTSFSYQTFRKYLDMVFMYAGTLSLSKELKPVPIKSMQIGDVFIYGGSPGHAVIVMDICNDPKTGKKMFMLAQSYMPAQEIHVLKNENNPAISPWYELNESPEIKTPEWTFTPQQLKRFQ